MGVSFKEIRKVTALGALCTSLTLLAACSSGSDDDDNVDTGTANDPVSEPANEGETQTPVAGDSALGSELISSWVACSDGPGLRVEFVFDGTNFTNNVGVGSCDGFVSADQVLPNAGPYEIIGTTTTETGLTAFIMELTTTTIAGSMVFDSLVETRTRLAFVSDSAELFFSSDAREGEELPTALNLDIPYVRF